MFSKCLAEAIKAELVNLKEVYQRTLSQTMILLLQSLYMSTDAERLHAFYQPKEQICLQACMHAEPCTPNLHVSLSATGTQSLHQTCATMISSAFADWDALTVLIDCLQSNTAVCLAHLPLLKAGLLWAAFPPCCSKLLASLPKAGSTVGCLDLLCLGFTEELHRNA